MTTPMKTTKTSAIPTSAVTAPCGCYRSNRGSSCASPASLSSTPASWRTTPGCCVATACDLAELGPAGQDRFVTEARSPLDSALDLLIYAPVGFALTAAEEIPKLAAKGRAQLGGQVAMAKV